MNTPTHKLTSQRPPIPRKIRVQEYNHKNDRPCHGEFHLTGLGVNAIFCCGEPDGHKGDCTHEITSTDGRAGKVTWKRNG